jgi:hypothetical protein
MSNIIDEKNLFKNYEIFSKLFLDNTYVLGINKFK